MYRGGQLPLTGPGGSPARGARGSGRVPGSFVSAAVRGSVVVAVVSLVLLSFALKETQHRKAPEAQGKAGDGAPVAEGQAALEAPQAGDGGEPPAAAEPGAGRAEESAGGNQQAVAPAIKQDTTAAVAPEETAAPAVKQDTTATVAAETTAAAPAVAAVDESGPDPSRPSKCGEACFEHGTCNEELGECFCLPPWGGPDCTELAMPSCQLADNFWTVCKDITTCECARECQKFALPQHIFCFRGTNPDGTKITNLTEIFSGPRWFKRWNADSTQLEPIDYNSPPVTDASPQISPEECPGMCGGKSVCGREHKNCYCSWATQGIECEQTPSGLRVPCFNGCSGRGQCLYGSCKCDKGYFGMDCSLYIGRDGRPRILERPPYNWTKAVSWPKDNSKLRPRVYVYDLPTYFNTWQGLYSNFLDWAEPIWFMERIHNTPYRTLNGDEADFFFLPLFIRNREGANRANVVRLAQEYIKAKYPFWARSGGADHFIFTNSDWGNCEMGGTWGWGYGHMNPVLDDMFSLTLWGCAKSMDLDDDRPCFRPGRDIVAPPDQDIAVYEFAPGIAPKPPEPPFDKRDILLYFRGYMATDTHPWGKGNYTWSFHVRQEMYRLYQGKGNTTGIVLEVMETGPWDHWHLRQMQRSIFCLGPAGWGWGMRAPQVVIMGCIPVVIQPFTYQALDGDGLDWKEFAVFLTKEDIPNIEQILRAIPQDEIERKRKAIEKHRSKFIWSSTNYNPLQFLPQEEQDRRAGALLEADAFVGIMDALRMKLQRAGKL